MKITDAALQMWYIQEGRGRTPVKKTIPYNCFAQN